MLVRVRVKTGVRKESFAVTNETNFLIAIRELPERNAANARVRQLLSEYFEVAISRVKLVAGHHAPQKTFSITVD